MDIKGIKVDSVRGERGDWIDNIPGMGDLRLYVRSFSNTDYQAFLAAEVAKVPPKDRVGGVQSGALLPHIKEAILTRGLVAHILRDWQNLTEGGVTVDYSEEMAMNYMADPDYRQFREVVEWAAGQVEKYREAEVEAAVGNS